MSLFSLTKWKRSLSASSWAALCLVRPSAYCCSLETHLVVEPEQASLSWVTSTSMVVRLSVSPMVCLAASQTLGGSVSSSLDSSTFGLPFCPWTWVVAGPGWLESSATMSCQPGQRQGKSHGWLSCSPSVGGHPSTSHRSPHIIAQLQRSARRQGRAPQGSRCSTHPRSSLPSHA